MLLTNSSRDAEVTERVSFKGQGNAKDRKADLELTYYKKDIQMMKDGNMAAPKWSDERSEEDDVETFRKKIKLTEQRNKKIYGENYKDKAGVVRSNEA